MIVNFPHPSANPCPHYSPIWQCFWPSSTAHPTPNLLQSPGTQNLWLIFLCVCVCETLWLYCWHDFLSFALKKYHACYSVILRRLSSGFCHVVQVKFAASGSTGRMFPSRLWFWTSPPARGSSAPKRSWIASCRRSTLSPSKLTTAERVLMAPIWRNPTSKSSPAGSERAGASPGCCCWYWEFMQKRQSVIRLHFPLFKTNLDHV